MFRRRPDNLAKLLALASADYSDNPVLLRFARAAVAEKIAFHVGEDIAHRASFLADELAINHKSDNDPVTDLDSYVEEQIRAILSEIDPRAEVLGEESGNGKSKVVWLEGSLFKVRYVVDPIDGTRNFMRHGDEWCVSIAIEEMHADGTSEVVACAIYRPLARDVQSDRPGDLFTAVAGHGAYRNGRLFRRPDSADVDLSAGVLGTGITSDRKIINNQLDRFGEVVRPFGDFSRYGSIVTSIVKTALGERTAFLEGPNNYWDFAAAILFAREAGCVVGFRQVFDNGKPYTKVDGHPMFEALVAGPRAFEQANRVLATATPVFVGQQEFTRDQILQPAPSRDTAALVL